jgi:hypothetical protein
VLLAVACALVWYLLPASGQAVVEKALSPLLGSVTELKATGEEVLNVSKNAVFAGRSQYVALTTLIAGLAAFALALPVSWVYMFTRQKKGYSQSLVQALVLMPVVIAVIAALVRNSVALAFSLAGIISAVRFRTTLDDSRDAAFMFVVAALGLACGVQLEVAAVLSIMFVVLTLGFWFTDFARTPPGLEGTMADRRLTRALAIANRTSQFVARLDHEIIEGMAPQQLDSLAAKIDKRKKDLLADSDEGGPRFDGRIRIAVSDADAAQGIVENVLEQNLKKWKLVRTDQKEGFVELVYAVRMKKGHVLDELKDVMMREGVPYVMNAEVGAWI